MGEHDARVRSGRTATVFAVVVLTAVAVCTVAVSCWLVGPDGPAHEAVGTLDESATATPSPAVGADGLFPTRISLPTVGVETGVEPTPTTAVYSEDRQQTVSIFGLPSRRASAAWWSNGPRPGSDGISVFVGESGNRTDPGAFDAIGDMRRGDEIVLRSARDEVVTYLVSDVVAGVRAGDPANLQKTFESRRVAKAVALVTYDAVTDLAAVPALADVVVFGHLRTD
ncbi:class F sortase [Gordonia hydrophobica]|uniref:Class F sortase n=1 Tax=Gordonia hydrophobica TaxID=40516 RepID=A0ABZ2U6R1_9ACTN|nr:class F sortase [Gordonia hydrophobica]MBM7366157.1 hypothetical protein [Gordonia hydrophobica]